MNRKLHIIPNMVLGIKLRDLPISFYTISIHLEYNIIDVNAPATLVINNTPVEQYMQQIFDGSILIESKDQHFADFDKLSEVMNVSKYSYEEIYDGGDPIEQPDTLYELIFLKWEDILREYLSASLKEQNIDVQQVTLNIL